MNRLPARSWPACSWPAPSLSAPALLAGSLLAAALAGCGVPAEHDARPLQAGEAPFGLLAPATQAAQPPGARSESLLFVRDSQLVPVTRQAVQVTPRSVLSDLFAGPSAQERMVGLTTALPSGVQVGEVVVTDGLASVAVDGELLDSGRSDQVLALAQVVLTLTGLDEVDAVQFLRAGQTLPVPRADGALSAGPVTAADYASLLAAPGAPR